MINNTILSLHDADTGNKFYIKATAIEWFGEEFNDGGEFVGTMIARDKTSSKYMLVKERAEQIASVFNCLNIGDEE